MRKNLRVSAKSAGKNVVGVAWLNTNGKLLEARSQLPAANEILIQTMCVKICEYLRNLRANVVGVATLKHQQRLMFLRTSG